jgi:hypothetical protein
MIPESLLEWILSIGEITEVEANAIFDQLLWEISKEGLDIVPRRQLLRLFHNTIDASRLKLDEILSEYRELIRDKYAIEPSNAFTDLDPLIIPCVVEEVNSEVMKTLKALLAKEQLLRADAEERAKATIKDKKEYDRLKADKKQRGNKAKKEKRAAQSRPGKKRRRKRNK